MNERLLEYLPDPNTVKGGIAAVAETIQAEAPKLVSEILLWHKSLYGIGIIAGIVLIIAAIAWWKKTMTWAKSRENDGSQYRDGDSYAVPWSGLTIFIVTGNILFWTNLCLATKIMIAPRLFMLEYIMTLVK